MLKLQVENFGPIVEGRVKLKPFTVFIGPNNAGKSYLATLLYSHLHYVNRGVPFSFPFPGNVVLDHFSKWYEQHAPKIYENGIRVKIGELPKEVKNYLCQNIPPFTERIIHEELQRCFSEKITHLVRKERGVNSFRVYIQQEEPNWQIEFYSSDNSLIEKRNVDISPLSSEFKLHPDERRYEELPLISFLNRLYCNFCKDIPEHTYYLPAARSGILQAHRALTGTIVSRSSLVGIEPIEIPRLSGVVADFISGLLNLEKRGRKKKEPCEIAQFLEKEVTKGDIDIEVGKIEYPEVYYKQPKVGKLSLHRTSSMVSELAPVVLFLKYLVNPEDLLIIEEPESHLHPEAQTRLVRCLVKLVRAEVKVLITTHSDYLLGELNNFIRLSQVPKDARKEKGYSEEDYLNPDEVGGYLFDWNEKEGGSIVKELEVTPEDGIPEDEFVKVVEALGNKAAYLERRIPQRIS